MRQSSIAGTDAARRLRLLVCDTCTDHPTGCEIFAIICRGVEMFVCAECRDRWLAVTPPPTIRKMEDVN